MSMGVPQVLGPSADAQGLRNFVTGPGGGKPPLSRKERDFFLLPVLPVQPSSGYSRGCRDSIQARNRPTVVVNEAVETLNWMNGCGFEAAAGVLREEDNTGATAEVFAWLTDLAQAMDAEAKINSEAAFRELLKGRGEFTLDGSTSLAPFKLESVSLPDSLSACRPVSDLCGDEGRRYLKWKERMTLSADEMKDRPPEEISPYTDPARKHNRPLYLKFIKKLMGTDSLCWTKYPKCRAGVNFGRKHDGRIRMIIDARRSNRMFRPPPGVDLCTAEGLSRTEVVLPAGVMPWSAEGKKKIAEVGLCMGLADVDNCFHRCRQPFWLAEHFALEPVRASEANMVGQRVSGEEVCPDDEIFPWPGSLCTGFSWSLHSAQRSPEKSLNSCPSLVESSLVTDQNGGFTLDLARPDEVKHTVYVDNLGVISQNGPVTLGILEEMDKEFGERQLLLHPSSAHTEEGKHLGTKMDLRHLCSILTRSRYEKLKGGLQAVMRRRRLSGRVPEVVIGHRTFAGLACRPLLSIFHACYKFINRHYFERGLEWRSVSGEVRAFMGGLIFCGSDRCRRWNPVVQCTDSSKSGWGITSAVWERNQVAAVGRVLERSRFKRDGAYSARESALAEANIDIDDLKRSWRNGYLSSEDCLRDSSWTLDNKFPEVPYQLLKKEQWEPRYWGRWVRDKHITLLEDRTMTKTCKRIALTVYGKNSQQLMLGDNFSAVLSFERRRAKDFELLVQVRKACSYQLAVNMHMAYRWVPSELCTADSTSRLNDPKADREDDRPLEHEPKRKPGSECAEEMEQVPGPHDERKHRACDGVERGSDQEREQELPGACEEVEKSPVKARRGRRHRRRSEFDAGQSEYGEENLSDPMGQPGAEQGECWGHLGGCSAIAAADPEGHSVMPCCVRNLATGSKAATRVIRACPLPAELQANFAPEADEPEVMGAGYQKQEQEPMVELQGESATGIPVIRAGNQSPEHATAPMDHSAGIPVMRAGNQRMELVTVPMDDQTAGIPVMRAGKQQQHHVCLETGPCDLEELQSERTTGIPVIRAGNQRPEHTAAEDPHLYGFGMDICLPCVPAVLPGWTRCYPHCEIVQQNGNICIRSCVRSLGHVMRHACLYHFRNQFAKARLTPEEWQSETTTGKFCPARDGESHGLASLKPYPAKLCKQLAKYLLAVIIFNGPS